MNRSWSLYLTASWDPSLDSTTYRFRIERDDEGLSHSLLWSGRVPLNEDPVVTAILVLETTKERLEDDVIAGHTDSLFSRQPS